MEKHFDTVIANGIIYDRKQVLDAVEEWMKQNVILQFGVVRVVNDFVKPDLFNMFDIEPHYPLVYKEKGLNGVNFLTNIILECGIQAGRNEKDIEMKQSLRKKEEEYAKILEEKNARIAQLEKELKEQQKALVKKNK